MPNDSKGKIISFLIKNLGSKSKCKLNVYCQWEVQSYFLITINGFILPCELSFILKNSVIGIQNHALRIFCDDCNMNGGGGVEAAVM